MRLAAAAWSFVGASLLEAARMCRALDLDAIDLIAMWDAPLDSRAMVADPKQLSLEYEFDPGWMGMDRVDVATESIKMARRGQAAHLALTPAVSSIIVSMLRCNFWAEPAQRGGSL